MLEVATTANNSINTRPTPQQPNVQTGASTKGRQSTSSSTIDMAATHPTETVDRASISDIAKNKSAKIKSRQLKNHRTKSVKRANPNTEPVTL